MPRQLRMEYPGAIYHVMNRGDRREDIFLDDGDRRRFLETLEEACAKTDWQVHAYCLMRNHFHLVIETPRANLVAGMQWLLGTYTARFNRKHNVFGHLFSGRYKSLIVDGSGTGYLKTVCDYVHLNPVRAGLLKPGQPLQAYPWSSYGQYLLPPRRRRSWLRADRLLGEWGVNRDDASGRAEFDTLIERRRAEDTGDLAGIRRGWCWGTAAFRDKLLAVLGEEEGETHYTGPIQEAAQEKAGRIIAEELRRTGWREADLGLRRKGDAFKVRLAARLRKETTVRWRWIAERLRMGHWRSAANAVRLARVNT